MASEAVSGRALMYSPRRRAERSNWLTLSILLVFAVLYVGWGDCQMQAQAGRAPAAPQQFDVKVNEDVQQSIVLVVFDASKALLDRQSIVKLYDPARKVTVWRTTSDKSETSFYDLSGGTYDIDVSAVGFKPQHMQVLIAYAQQARHVEVLLERDPTAIDLNVSDDLIPAKHRKDAKRAVYALKSGKLTEAQKQLDKVYKFAPSSPQLNFLYGYLYLGLKDLDKAESYLSQSAALDPRGLQTLNLLGRVQLQLQHNRDAQATLEQLIAAKPQDWMAHNLLAGAYLNQKQYENAREQAQLALDEDRGAASMARLFLGEALVMLGRDKEGLEALQTFLRENPKDPAKADVQDLIAKIEAHEQGAVIARGARSATDAALAALPPELPVTPWGPPGVDESKPLVKTGVTCPYDQVLEMSGRRVQQLVEDISQFSATEHLLHERLDKFGNPTSKENRKFGYLATITENPPGYFGVDEDRQLQSGDVGVPDDIVTRGFMGLALIFHPHIRGDFQMSCEGLSDFQGNPAWLMYFRQRDDRPSHFGRYLVGTQPYDVRLKGRAWISAKNFEVVRMESELLNPVDRLSVQHQIVQYGPIHFKDKNVDLWLPKSVDLYLEINKRRYYRQHSFDQYLLFSVDSQQKLPTLKAGPNGTLVPGEDHCSDPSSPACQTDDTESR
jgi:tetratricopeptide (TPR) repeat protein